uniref:Reverse transcriptase domain-containing protein n=1 Tax=Caenorhabditis tropicalis TaxID=1561998 RepID=A0A1I7TZU3_9PELO
MSWDPSNLYGNPPLPYDRSVDPDIEDQFDVKMALNDFILESDLFAPDCLFPSETVKPVQEVFIQDLSEAIKKMEKDKQHPEIIKIAENVLESVENTLMLTGLLPTSPVSKSSSKFGKSAMNPHKNGRNSGSNHSSSSSSNSGNSDVMDFKETNGVFGENAAKLNGSVPKSPTVDNSKAISNLVVFLNNSNQEINAIKLASRVIPVKFPSISNQQDLDVNDMNDRAPMATPQEEIPQPRNQPTCDVSLPTIQNVVERRRSQRGVDRRNYKAMNDGNWRYEKETKKVWDCNGSRVVQVKRAYKNSRTKRGKKTIEVKPTNEKISKPIPDNETVVYTGPMVSAFVPLQVMLPDGPMALRNVFFEKKFPM